MLNIFMLCLISILLLLLRPFYHPYQRSSGNYRPGRFGNRGDFSSPEEGEVNWLTGEGLLYNQSSKPKVAADPYGRLREPFVNWLTGQIGQPGPSYTGELTAPMSGQETQSLDFLNKYANRGTPETFTNAKNYTNEMLTGDYDPATSPYYQAVKAGAERNLAKTKENIASDAAGGGRFWTGARMKQQANADIDTTNSLNKVLGSLFETQQGRKLQAAQLAESLAKTEDSRDLNTTAALQSFGALPRQIQQAQDTALYNQFLKSNYDWPLSIANIIAGVQSPPVYQQADNSMQNFLGNAGSMATNLALMAAFGLI